MKDFTPRIKSFYNTESDEDDDSKQMKSLFLMFAIKFSDLGVLEFQYKINVRFFVHLKHLTTFTKKHFLLEKRSS